MDFPVELGKVRFVRALGMESLSASTRDSLDDESIIVHALIMASYTEPQEMSSWAVTYAVLVCFPSYKRKLP